MSVFIKQNDLWIKFEDVDEGCSTNDCLQALGYYHNQFYSFTNYNMPYEYGHYNDNILMVCLKVMSEDIICVIASPGRQTLTNEEVTEYMQDFDFAHDYSRYSLESDLDCAIVEHNYSIQFVADALGLSFSPDDKMLHSSRLKYNFFFDGGFLVGYEISDGYNREAHEMKDQGSWVYDLIEKHSINYHGKDDEAAIREINIQAKAYYKLPGGIKNDYLDSFKNSDGSYNFMMLLVAMYQETEHESIINYSDCKCICHQELKYDGTIDVGLDKLLNYKYRDYVISFDDKGKFLSCKNYLQSIKKSDSTGKNIEVDNTSKENDFLNNFFGVDIFNEPNESWEYEGKFEGTGKGYYFIKKGLNNEFFTECKIIAFENGGSNFLWQPILYNENTLFSIVLTIERYLMGNVNMTYDQCVLKYQDRQDLSSIDMEYGDYKICINYGFDKNEIRLTLWTHINGSSAFPVGRVGISHS